MITPFRINSMVCDGQAVADFGCCPNHEIAARFGWHAELEQYCILE
jgi:hypothetical protein